MKEEQRIEVVTRLMDGQLEMDGARQVLGRSERQMYRLLKRFRIEGLKGLIHGNKGRACRRRVPARLKDRILRLVKKKYKDVNDTHMKELLARNEGIKIGRETLRGMLRSNNIAAKRKRRPPKYRARRDRRDAFGMMIQIDASHHDWLEDRGPRLSLLGGIDDATGHIWAMFEDAETTWGYMDLMREIFKTHGVPMSLYSDRHAIFHALREPTIIEQINNARPLTQFGRAMDEAGVRIIKAWSPQAKGRIERLWGTFQDRLVVELRLANVKTKDEANLFLRDFLKEYNRKFTKKPKVSTSCFKRSPVTTKLDRILCLKETRVVNKDHTISFEGLVLQIPPSKKFRSLAKRRVEVLQLRNGEVEVVHKKQVVARFAPESVGRLMKLYTTSGQIVLDKNGRKSQLKAAA